MIQILKASLFREKKLTHMFTLVRRVQTLHLKTGISVLHGWQIILTCSVNFPFHMLLNVLKAHFESFEIVFQRGMHFSFHVSHVILGLYNLTTFCWRKILKILKCLKAIKYFSCNQLKNITTEYVNWHPFNTIRSFLGRMTFEWH